MCNPGSPESLPCGIGGSSQLLSHFHASKLLHSHCYPSLCTGVCSLPVPTVCQSVCTPAHPLCWHPILLIHLGHRATLLLCSSMQTHACMHKHMRAHTHAHKSMHTYTHAHIHTCTHTCMHKLTRGCTLRRAAGLRVPCLPSRRAGGCGAGALRLRRDRALWPAPAPQRWGRAAGGGQGKGVTPGRRLRTTQSSGRGHCRPAARAALRVQVHAAVLSSPQGCQSPPEDSPPFGLSQRRPRRFLVEPGRMELEEPLLGLHLSWWDRDLRERALCSPLPPRLSTTHCIAKPSSALPRAAWI